MYTLVSTTTLLCTNIEVLCTSLRTGLETLDLHDGVVYLAVPMDVFTRSIRGWQLEQRPDHSLTRLALQRAVAPRLPESQHADQGVPDAATAYTQAREEAGVQISMAEVGAAWQNGSAERLIRTLNEEAVTLSEYADEADALRHVGRFLTEVYMHKRIHSALGSLTRAEFEDQSQRAQVEPLDVH